jgi:hypothetical protein
MITAACLVAWGLIGGRVKISDRLWFAVLFAITLIAPGT